GLDLGLQVQQAAAQLGVVITGAAQLFDLALAGQALGLDPLPQIENGAAGFIVLEQRGRRDRAGRQAQHGQAGGKGGAPRLGIAGSGTHRRYTISARRFCAQAASLLPSATGFSLPKLTASTWVSGTPSKPSARR